MIQIIIADFFTISSIIYMWHILLKRKINFKDYKLYITLALLIAITLINYYNVNAFMRIIIATLFLIIFFKLYFKEDLQKSIIIPVVCQIVVMFSELIFCSLLGIIFSYDANDVVTTQFGKLYSNVSIAAINCILVNLPVTKKLYSFLIKITDKVKRRHLIGLTLLVVIAANIYAGTIYYKINYVQMLIFNTLLTVVCLFIVANSYKAKNDYNKVSDKYNTTLNSLKEYENILDSYRISNHENKNQWLTVRNMIDKSDKKVVSYIDKILENKIGDNEEIMKELLVIPSGGLRGLIYSKVLYMKEKSIDYSIVISKEVKTFDLIDMEESLMLDTCKVVGIYLDNAIDAVEKLNKKVILIEMYMDLGKLCVAISNNYKGTIDIDKIEEKGYTTKGKGHGYGLTLAKSIIDTNKSLENLKFIDKNFFKQTLIINYNKKAD